MRRVILTRTAAVTFAATSSLVGCDGLMHSKPYHSILVEDSGSSCAFEKQTLTCDELIARIGDPKFRIALDDSFIVGKGLRTTPEEHKRFIDRLRAAGVTGTIKYVAVEEF